MSVRDRIVAVASKSHQGRRAIAVAHTIRWHHRVQESGLFDEKWYLATYRDVAGAGLDPISHYLRHGFWEGRSPGPRFDGPWYWQKYPDVARAGKNPLVHYIRRGKVEGREIRSLGGTSRMIAEHGDLPLSTPFDPVVPGRIAIVVHAYYADVFDEICRLLSALPMRVSLFVAVPTTAGERAARESIRKHHVTADVSIRVCQNRGRNFGSFLVEFGPEVAKYGVVLHLHTKKSLYSGAEQTQWRNHLYDSLLGSPQLVGLILSQFATREDLGVISPGAGQVMPYWAHHWLSNAHVAPALMARLGVTEYPAQGYIDYPVGGMFWARVDAIRPLLTAGFTYEDFPPEGGQTDGTLAHAIERSIIMLAQARGYGYGEVDLAADCIHENWSPKNLAQYAATSETGLRRAIEEADLVSFDVFDTLVTRPSASPDAVLRLVGSVLHQQGAPADFFEVRKQAEHAARAAKGFAGDVTLDEIYGQFGTVDGSWGGTAASAARGLELAMEEQVIRPREAGTSAARYARARDKRVIAITDTYYPREVIARLLEIVGLDGVFDTIYTSSAAGARKDRGDLWQYVMDSEQVPPQRWLHIGDNEQSDIQGASDRGLHTFHLMNPSILSAVSGFESAIGNRHSAGDWGTDITLGPLVKHVGDAPFISHGQFRPLEFDSAYDVGYTVFGPLMYAFTAWIANHPTTSSLRHLYFLSREGYALRRFYETVRAQCPALALPESSYFLTSRRMVLSAVQGVQFAPAEVLANHNVYRGTLGSLLRSRLGLVLPELTDANAIEIELPRDEDEVVEYLTILEQQISEHGRTDLALYRQYLDESDMAQAGTVGVVDIGYSGTIQRNLQEVLRRGLVGYYMATFKDISAVARQGGVAFGCFCDGESLWSPGVPVVRHSLLLEALLTAPHGQLAGFTKDGDELRPVFKADPRSEEHTATLAEMHQGADDYCRDILAAYPAEYRAAILSAPLDLGALQEPLLLLANKQIVVPQAVAEALAVEDDFTGTQHHLVGKGLASSRAAVPAASLVGR